MAEQVIWLIPAAKRRRMSSFRFHVQSRAWFQPWWLTEEAYDDREAAFKAANRWSNAHPRWSYRVLDRGEEYGTS